MGCYIVVTIRSLAWTILSVAVVFMHVLALIGSNWLLGPEQVLEVDYMTDTNVTVDPEVGNMYSTSLGIFTQCNYIYRDSGKDDTTCFLYVKRFLDLPSFLWMIMVLFYALGLIILTLTGCVSVLSLCTRTMCEKSIFTLTGFVQAIAGLFILLGLIVYPFGWGSDTVKEVCGSQAAPFLPAFCSVGWSLLLAIGALLLTFACSFVAVQAEYATSSDHVEDKVMNGDVIVFGL